jgi:hypothetical protein
MNFVKYKKLTLFLMVLFCAASLTTMATVSAAQYTWTQTSIQNPTYNESCYLDACWDYETNYPYDTRIKSYSIFKEVMVGDDFTIIFPKQEKGEYKLKNGKTVKNDITTKLQPIIQDEVRDGTLTNLSSNEITIDGKNYYAYHFHANAPTKIYNGYSYTYIPFSTLPVHGYQLETSIISYHVKIV